MLQERYQDHVGVEKETRLPVRRLRRTPQKVIRSSPEAG
jgi:hypothetical protein